jgi:hypothetical protein
MRPLVGRTRDTAVTMPQTRAASSSQAKNAGSSAASNANSDGAIISFSFNTAVLALAINLAASMI